MAAAASVVCLPYADSLAAALTKEEQQPCSVGSLGVTLGGLFALPSPDTLLGVGLCLLWKKIPGKGEAHLPPALQIHCWVWGCSYGWTGAGVA